MEIIADRRLAPMAISHLLSRMMPNLNMTNSACGLGRADEPSFVKGQKLKIEVRFWNFAHTRYRWRSEPFSSLSEHSELARVKVCPNVSQSVCVGESSSANSSVIVECFEGVAVELAAGHDDDGDADGKQHEDLGVPE